MCFRYITLIFIESNYIRCNIDFQKCKYVLNINNNTLFIIISQFGISNTSGKQKPKYLYLYIYVKSSIYNDPCVWHKIKIMFFIIHTKKNECFFARL